jgi:hypothetical protein
MKDKDKPIRYFLIRRKNHSISDESDIYGLTTDEEYAKSKISVFFDYEEVKMLIKS